jgi:hypothetical protein
MTSTAKGALSVTSAYCSKRSQASGTAGKIHHVSVKERAQQAGGHQRAEVAHR